MRILALLAILSAAGCETLKPYEKEYLLSPLMDDQGVTPLTPVLTGAAQARFERLAVGAEAAGGSACPTCGG